MRKIIAALQTSIDGLIEGPEGYADWVESWEDLFGLHPGVDACVLGGGMYGGYEQYWLAVRDNPDGVLELGGRKPTPGELAHLRFAVNAPHYVLSSKLDKAEWKTTRFVRGIADIAALKRQPGKNIYAVGGAKLISSLMDEGLVDELRLVVHPLVVGQGKPLFAGVTIRRGFDLVSAEAQKGGQVRLSYTART